MPEDRLESMHVRRRAEEIPLGWVAGVLPRGVVPFEFPCQLAAVCSLVPRTSYRPRAILQTLTNQTVTVELKNDVCITGRVHSIDQYLNIKLHDISVANAELYPHLLSVKNCFIRGSVVRYIQLPVECVDEELLHDSTRREARGG